MLKKLRDLIINRREGAVKRSSQAGIVGQMMAAGILLVGAVTVASTSLLSTTQATQKATTVTKTLDTMNVTWDELTRLETRNLFDGALKTGRQPASWNEGADDGIRPGSGDANGCTRLPEGFAIIEDAWGTPFCYMPAVPSPDRQVAGAVVDAIFTPDDYNNWQGYKSVGLPSLGSSDPKVYKEYLRHKTAMILVSAGPDGKFQAPANFPFTIDVRSSDDIKQYLSQNQKNFGDDVVRMITYDMLAATSVETRVDLLEDIGASEGARTATVGTISLPGCNDDNSFLVYRDTGNAFEWRCEYVDAAVVIPNEGAPYPNDTYKLDPVNLSCPASDQRSTVKDGMTLHYCNLIPTCINTEALVYKPVGGENKWICEDNKIDADLAGQTCNEDDIVFLENGTWTCGPQRIRLQDCGQFDVPIYNGTNWVCASNYVDPDDQWGVECVQVHNVNGSLTDYDLNYNPFNYTLSQVAEAAEVPSSDPVYGELRSSQDNNNNDGLAGVTGKNGWYVASCSAQARANNDAKSGRAYNIHNGCFVSNTRDNQPLLTATLCKGAIAPPPVCMGDSKALQWDSAEGKWICDDPCAPPASPNINVAITGSTRDIFGRSVSANCPASHPTPVAVNCGSGKISYIFGTYLSMWPGYQQQELTSTGGKCTYVRGPQGTPSGVEGDQTIRWNGTLTCRDTNPDPVSERTCAN